MQTIMGLALIAGIAYALLRLLAWLGQVWERGYLFKPIPAHLPYQLGDFRDAETEEELARRNPAFNVDGTPMIGAFDMKGRMYGVTLAHGGKARSHSDD